MKEENPYIEVMFYGQRVRVDGFSDDISLDKFMEIISGILNLKGYQGDVLKTWAKEYLEDNNEPYWSSEQNGSSDD